jgi:hypothetical protein
MPDPDSQLTDKIKDWLLRQGYPLEFRVAAAFQNAGIEAVQGFYVRQRNTNSVRELDVVARIRSHVADMFASINLIVECKWSGDKPWIVFTAPRTRMAPSACIAQTIGSYFGEAIMHCLAAEQELHSFHTSDTSRDAITACLQKGGNHGSDLAYAASHLCLTPPGAVRGHNDIQSSYTVHHNAAVVTQSVTNSPLTHRVR